MSTSVVPVPVSRKAWLSLLSLVLAVLCGIAAAVVNHYGVLLSALAFLVLGPVLGILAWRDARRGRVRLTVPLIEVLVVLGVIGLLSFLLLPAI